MEYINWVAVFCAALASFAFGALWYSPVLFMKAWVAASGADPTQHKLHPLRVFGLSFIFTLVTSFVLAFALGPDPSAPQGAVFGAGAALGLVMASMGINYQFANRSFSHWLIDGGFHVGRFIVMGVIIAAWP